MSNPFRKSLRMPGRRIVWNPSPKGIRYEKVPHPNLVQVAFGKSPSTAYRVYYKGKVLGIVCQVMDYIEHKIPNRRVIYRTTHVVRWLPIATGRTYYTASEMYKDTRGEAAARLVEMASLGKAFG